jgi:hypothetical protein
MREGSRTGVRGRRGHQDTTTNGRVGMELRGSRVWRVVHGGLQSRSGKCGGRRRRRSLRVAIAGGLKLDFCTPHHMPNMPKQGLHTPFCNLWSTLHSHTKFIWIYQASSGSQPVKGIQPRKATKGPSFIHHHAETHYGIDSFRALSMLG